MEITYRKVTTLGEVELERLVKKIFKPEKIERLVYNLRQNIVTAYIYPTKEDVKHSLNKEAIVISATGLTSPTGYCISKIQNETALQFLAAKGCLSVFKANPFMKKVKREAKSIDELLVEFEDITGLSIKYNPKKYTMEASNFTYQGDGDQDCARYVQAMIDGINLRTLGAV